MTSVPNVTINHHAVLSESDTDTDCIIVDWNTTRSWDNPNNLISLNTKKTIEKIVTGIIIPILFFTGAPANIINMIVFFKQGLRERINLCLFCLALVDLSYLTFILTYYSDNFYRTFTEDKYGKTFIYMINNNIIGLNGLGYSSAFIAVIISMERCICVLFPLRAQSCIPTKVLGVIIVLGVCVSGFIRFLVTAKYHVNCYYEKRTGRISYQTTASEFYYENKKLIDTVDGIYYGFCLAIGFPVIVLTTTIITAVKLKQTLRFRLKSSSSAMSDREIGVTKMLIWLSMEFFVLSLPKIILRIVPMFGTPLNVSGDYSNLYFVLISFSFACLCTSASVNFFVYYFTGSRYRQTLHALLRWASSSQKHGGHSDLSEKTRETSQGK